MCGAKPKRVKMGTKTGAKIAHLDDPRDDDVQNGDEDNQPEQQGKRTDTGALQQIRHDDGRDGGHACVVKVGDELADHPQHKDETGQAGERLGDGADDVIAALDRPRSLAMLAAAFDCVVMMVTSPGLGLDCSSCGYHA